MTRAISIDTRFTRAIITLIAALMLAILAAPAKAHHGWSEYDASKRATIKDQPSATMIANASPLSGFAP